MGTEQTVVHILAGGIAGTTGAVLTCPLEVVKTRLQSSVATFSTSPVFNSPNVSQVFLPSRQTTYSYCTCTSTCTETLSVAHSQSCSRTSHSLVSCLRFIVENEGLRGLFKGLGPNLVGVAPSRAIYFAAYEKAKVFCNSTFTPNTPIVHICSAAFAGFTSSTCTNPIWFVKTRLQLDQKRAGSLTIPDCINHVYQTSGIRGFYKGITASYFGISETVVHFVIYEAIKQKLQSFKNPEDARGTMDFVEFMGAGATSKTIATCLAYPHEVVRTRLRQEGDKYKRFLQTLTLVFREESYRGLYRGLATQLVRQIPNTAIMMSTYEAVVFLCNRHILYIDEDNY